MLNRGKLFLKKLNEERGKIVKLAVHFITHKAVSRMNVEAALNYFK